MQSLPMLFMLVALVAMWFFMTRSQKKQQQERQSLLDNMKVGDEIVTIGGLHGVLSEINEEKKTVVLDCEGIYLEFDRASVRTVKPITAVEEPTATEIETTEIITPEEPAAEEEPAEKNETEEPKE